MKLERAVPWIAAIVALAASASTLLPLGRVRGFDLAGFSTLPVLEGGRVKPIDTVARNSLLMLRSQQGFRYQGHSIGPDEWLLDVMFRPAVANEQPAFVINDPEVLGLIGLKQTADRYFSFATIVAHIDEIEKQAMAAQQVDSKERTRFQGAVLNLYNQLNHYYRLQNSIQLASGPGLAAELKTRTDAASAQSRQALAQTAEFRILPPLPGERAESWRNVGEALGQADLDPGLPALAQLAAAYEAQDAVVFNAEVGELRAISAARQPGALQQAGSEAVFNRAEPFYLGMVIYVLALLVLFASWLWKPAILQPTAYSLLLSGAVVHTAGLLARMILQGRPPVTNLYSSAIFVGWAAVIVGIVLEWMYRKGFGTAVAASAGFGSLIVAHHLMGDGDTMEMMRAVLDSNIWLATHVVTITIGYSGMFLAGALAIGYVARKHFAPRLDPDTTKTLVAMTYGVVCFALFFSFVGTVLGGIWADQSWGRFWGWDPKENGALLIVLWSAIILHARWGGFVREKGIMAMAIFGNVITALSWFGVNMLGVGLHSYGFMDKAFWALSAFCASQLVLIGLCLLPRQFWKAQAAAVAAPEVKQGGAAAAP